MSTEGHPVDIPTTIGKSWPLGNPPVRGPGGCAQSVYKIPGVPEEGSGGGKGYRHGVYHKNLGKVEELLDL